MTIPRVIQVGPEVWRALGLSDTGRYWFWADDLIKVTGRKRGYVFKTGSDQDRVQNAPKDSWFVMVADSSIETPKWRLAGIFQTEDEALAAATALEMMR